MLTDTQLDRYARHIILREVGGVGQAQLLQAKVAVIGAGGLGSPIIQYLAAAGVGHLTIIDDDRVSLSNLQRQTLFQTADIGRLKTEVAAQFVQALNPDVRVTTIAERLNAENAESLLKGHDVVIDGCDNFETRLLVAATAYHLRTTLVSAAVGQFDGQIARFRGWEAGNPCYQCFVGNDPAQAGQSCADQGIVGALTGLVGSWGALEVIRSITNFAELPHNQLLLIDTLAMQTRRLTIAKDPSCLICGHHPA